MAIDATCMAYYNRGIAIGSKKVRIMRSATDTRADPVYRYVTEVFGYLIAMNSRNN